MSRYAIAKLSRRTNHPVLVGLVFLAGVLALVAVGLRQAVGDGLLTGFLTVYAIMAAALGVGGLLLAAVAQRTSRVIRRFTAE